MKKASTPFLLVAFALALAAACTPDDDSKPAGTPTTPTGGTESPITLGRPSVHPGADYLVLARDTSLALAAAPDSLYFYLAALPARSSSIAYLELVQAQDGGLGQVVERYPKTGFLAKAALGKTDTIIAILDPATGRQIGYTITTKTPSQQGQYEYTVRVTYQDGYQVSTKVRVTLNSSGGGSPSCAGKQFSVVFSFNRASKTLRLDSAEGGVAPYTYRYLFQGVAQGDYDTTRSYVFATGGTLQIVIRDAEGCTDTMQYTPLLNEDVTQITMQNMSTPQVPIGGNGTYDIETKQKYNISEYEAKKGIIDFVAYADGDQVPFLAGTPRLASPSAPEVASVYSVNTANANETIFVQIDQSSNGIGASPGEFAAFERINSREEIAALFNQGTKVSKTNGSNLYVFKAGNTYGKLVIGYGGGDAVFGFNVYY
ncbi:MAG: hypothetical protein ACK51A_11475 [Sphingobacteriia bacterium]